jgi:hypothetical protein
MKSRVHQLDACLYWASLDGVFSVAKSALPPAPDPEAGAPPGSCVLGDAGTSPCDIGLACAIPDAGLAGCTVCSQPDGAPVDCRQSGEAVACGALACGTGCACADMDAGTCTCGAPRRGPSLSCQAEGTVLEATASPPLITDR